MKITRITENKKGSNTFNLYIDGSFALHISGETLFKLKLKENMELTEAGYDTVEKIKVLALEDLTKLDGIGKKTAEKIIKSAQGM